MYQDPNQRQDPYSGYGGVPQSSNPYGTPPSQSSQPLQQNSYGAPAQNPYGAGYGQPAQPSPPGYYVPIPGYDSQSNYGMPPNYGTLPNYGTRPNYQQQNLSRPRHWYGNGRRVFYGGLWSFYTVVLALAFIHYLSVGSFTNALLSGGFALLIGIYAYRIWTWRARRLWLLIFF
jgi:hypothetical protein